MYNMSILTGEVEAIGYVMRIYGHFHLNQYNPYVIMQAFTVTTYHSELILDTRAGDVCSSELCYFRKTSSFGTSDLPW
jgi:hypothetical protein